MKKYLIVSNKKKNSFSEKLLQRFIDYETIDTLSGKQAEDIINSEKPELLLVDIKKPANPDMMNRLSFDSISGLRVTIFKVNSFKAILFSFFFPVEIIEYLKTQFLKTEDNLHISNKEALQHSKEK